MRESDTRPSRRTQACRRAGERSSPGPGDSRDRAAVDTTCAGLVSTGKALGLHRRRWGVRRRHQGRPLTVDRAKPRLIDRGDLLAALDRAAAGKVTIISAPAGSGKTSLLHTWADRPAQPNRFAVVQVQRDQHDAQQFWLALLSAVRRLRHSQRRGTASGDARLQRAGDGRPSALGARRCPRRHHAGD